MKLSCLWAAPEVDPINRKARSVPVLNVFNVYGRVFFFSWWGFMVAFWAWYTFPPLLTHTIKSNLHLTSAEVANSNIVSLCATLLIRLAAGPACDRFGPRWVFAGTLFIGSIPLGLAPLVHNAQGLYVSRFFIGILGGSFVPCLVWSTGFFDKNVIGTANALAGGWGNAGGGITYFIMPAVFDSFVAKGYSDGVAWRLTFVVPLVITITTGVLMLVLCPDTPTGKWSERHLHVEQNLATQDGDATPNTATTDSVVDVPGNITDKSSASSMGANSIQEGIEKDTKRPQKLAAEWDHEAAIPMPRSDILGAAKGEVVQKPTWSEIARVLVSPQTTFHVLTYLCSFGGELAINAVLGSYYVKNFPGLGQTNAANWAAMFGFLNVVTRPVGGAIADLLYRTCGRGYSSSSGNGSAGGGGGGGGSVWAKKIWIVVCGCVAGAALIVVGQVDPHDLSTMVGLVTLAALFIEAGNGANFALVPHVHPHANGVVSGTTGAGGNLGGVVFAIIFRFMGAGTDYAGAFWVIGVITIALNLVLCWVPPVPKGQVGGR